MIKQKGGGSYINISLWEIITGEGSREIAGVLTWRTAELKGSAYFYQPRMGVFSSQTSAEGEIYDHFRFIAKNGRSLSEYRAHWTPEIRNYFDAYCWVTA